MACYFTQAVSTRSLSEVWILIFSSTHYAYVHFNQDLTLMPVCFNDDLNPPRNMGIVCG